MERSGSWGFFDFPDLCLWVPLRFPKRKLRKYNPERGILDPARMLTLVIQRGGGNVINNHRETDLWFHSFIVVF